MTKDRISEMLKLMRDNNLSAEPRKSTPVETSESITSFLGQVECCRKEIQQMKDEIEILKKYHSQIQRCTHETSRKHLENKVEEQKTIITSSIMALRNNIKSIQDIFAKHKISPALRRMRDVQIHSLIQTVNEITQTYYNCLIEHSDKCKQLLYDMISLTNEDKGDFEELVEKGKIAFFTNNLLINEFEQKINFRNVENRHFDILKVEQSILELKNLTQDLSLVVAIQGDKVESVEEYVQKTKKKVDDAAGIMKAASKLKRKARWRKLLISVVCITVIVTTVIIIALI